jgi:hypothetical protein
MQLQDCFSMFAVEKSRNAYTALCVFFFVTSTLHQILVYVAQVVSILMK